MYATSIQHRYDWWLLKFLTGYFTAFVSENIQSHSCKIGAVSLSLSRFFAVFIFAILQ